MRSAVIVAFAACIASSWAVAAPRPKDPPKADPPSLVGEWVSDHDQGQQRYIFAADGKFTYVLGPGSTMNYTYTVDSKKAPAEIDLTPENGQVVLGIYKIEGDTLTACFTIPGADRPTKFEKSDAPHVGLSVYKRVKTKD